MVPVVVGSQAGFDGLRVRRVPGVDLNLSLPAGIGIEVHVPSIISRDIGALVDSDIVNVVLEDAVVGVIA